MATAAPAAPPMAAGAPMTLSAWLPDIQTALEDMTTKIGGKTSFEADLRVWFGFPLNWKALDWDKHWFDALGWQDWTMRSWHVPLFAVAVYIVSIPLLKRMVEKHGRWNVRNFAFCWNAALSIFSWCGVFACVPPLLDTLFGHGLYFTTCAPAVWYGTGTSGAFVALFIYSKLAELLDTVLLVLAKKPVIALQWWHHSTVLLYCWHSYSARIGTGLWFAAMNYSVHSVMYGYFALVSTRYRSWVTPYAIFITLGQLAQMLVGMFVTIKAVTYQLDGMECNVNKTNSVLGLLMYFSYFVLFFKLFIDNYVTRSRKRAKAVTSKGAVEDSSPEVSPLKSGKAD